MALKDHLIKKIILLVGIIAVLGIASSLVVITSPAYAANDGGVSSGGSRVISVLGIAKVQGEDVIVDILVEVQHGQNAKEVARAALQAQNARPFESASLGSAGFTVTGLVWDNLPVVQNYNPGSPNTQNEPFTAQTALTNTHVTWNGVSTSSFDINSGGTTDRCPSLVRECKGPQSFDGNNDVAWLKLGRSTLGVTWFGTSTDETDMALNTRFTWNDGCVDVTGSIDAQTVFLHENGHVVGLGHSDDTGSVMQPFYNVAHCGLGTDDQEGATFLYDSSITGSVSGTVIDDANNPIGSATVVLEDTGLSTTTAADGTYTISGVPDPVTYTVTASAGDASSTIDRLTVSGDTTGVDFTLSLEGGGGGGGSSGTAAALDIGHVGDDSPHSYESAVKDGTYANRDRVHIFVKVTDSTGNDVSGASVHITLVTPDPTKDLGGDATTGSDGVAHLHHKVNAARDGSGADNPYHIEAEVTGTTMSCTDSDGLCHADFTVQ